MAAVFSVICSLFPLVLFYIFHLRSFIVIEGVANKSELSSGQGSVGGKQTERERERGTFDPVVDKKTTRRERAVGRNSAMGGVA